MVFLTMFHVHFGTDLRRRSYTILVLQVSEFLLPLVSLSLSLFILGVAGGQLRTEFNDQPIGAFQAARRRHSRSGRWHQMGFIE